MLLKKIKEGYYLFYGLIQDGTVNFKQMYLSSLGEQTT